MCRIGLSVTNSILDVGGTQSLLRGTDSFTALRAFRLAYEACVRGGGLSGPIPLSYDAPDAAMLWMSASRLPHPGIHFWVHVVLTARCIIPEPLLATPSSDPVFRATVVSL